MRKDKINVSNILLNTYDLFADNFILNIFEIC